jgi:hypothetical protein
MQEACRIVATAFNHSGGQDVGIGARVRAKPALIAARIHVHVCQQPVEIVTNAVETHIVLRDATIPGISKLAAKIQSASGGREF